MEKLNSEEKKVALCIQGDIPLVSSPFDEMGAFCDLTADEILNISESFLEKGIMRKFGAVLRHQKAGYIKNALVVWSVPVELIEKTGNMFATFPSISHCYERKPAFINKYNIFTMLHTKDENILSLIKNMTIATGINDYLILESIQEYKKTSPEYF